MILRITAGALVAAAIVALSGLLPASPAAACNSIDGCVHAAQRENYDMMHDGRMGTMMSSGMANIEAFREMQAAGQPPANPPTKPGLRGRRP